VRTTVAIDDDLFEKLRDLAARRRQPFTRIVNETLRRGLAAPRARSTRRERFRADTFDSSFRPGVDPLRLNQLVDELEVRRLSEP
jgi:predicted transcriptional regulator